MNKLLILFAIILFSCNRKQSFISGHNYHGFTDTITFKLGADASHTHSDIYSFIEGTPEFIYPFYVDLREIKGKDTVYHIAFYEEKKDTAYMKGNMKLIFREIGKGFSENVKLIMSLHEEIDSLKREIYKLKTK